MNIGEDIQARSKYYEMNITQNIRIASRISNTHLTLPVILTYDFYQQLITAGKNWADDTDEF